MLLMSPEPAPFCYSFSRGRVQRRKQSVVGGVGGGGFGGVFSIG
jgi:hypothetical protein